MGFFEGLINSGPTPALQATWSFTQARHKVIAENVANMSTPDYKAKRLDFGSFQAALGRAFAERSPSPQEPFVIPDNGQVRTDKLGRLVTTPETKPGRNAVRHDGTNMSIEREMSELASNAMWHEMTTALLQGKFDGLRKAIRGRS
jgi:flagellar basal-body rod protein FlgB